MSPTETAPSGDATEIGRSGWRQGSVLGAELIELLQTDGHSLPAEGALALVLSHDCDVVNKSFEKEPWAELVWITPLAGPDSRMTLGKNTRCLHLPLSEAAGEVAWFEALSSNRFSLPRRLLLGASPSADRRLAVEQKRVVATWVARRYDRSAFPDAFNLRLPKSKSLARPLKTGGNWISALYISVNDEELPLNEHYKILLRALMMENDFQDPTRRAEADSCLQELAGLLDACDGIIVLEAELLSESEFTLDDVRSTKRWDFDWLSFPDPQE